MPQKPCPTCGKTPEKPHLPFCSLRCKQVDLGKWFSGSFAVPGEAVDPESHNTEHDETF